MTDDHKNTEEREAALAAGADPVRGTPSEGIEAWAIRRSGGEIMVTAEAAVVAHWERSGLDVVRLFPVGAGPMAEAAWELSDAAEALLELKRGPRNAAYDRDKPVAWGRLAAQARAVRRVAGGSE